MATRCMCVVETADGEFTRCSQMVLDPADDYCYYHAKVIDGLTEPDVRDDGDPMKVVAYHRRGDRIRVFA